MRSSVSRGSGPDEVAAEDDEVGVGLLDGDERCLERRQVSVDVGEDGDAHASMIAGALPLRQTDAHS